MQIWPVLRAYQDIPCHVRCGTFLPFIKVAQTIQLQAQNGVLIDREVLEVGLDRHSHDADFSQGP